MFIFSFHYLTLFVYINDSNYFTMLRLFYLNSDCYIFLSVIMSTYVFIHILYIISSISIYFYYLPIFFCDNFLLNVFFFLHNIIVDFLLISTL